MALNQPDDFEVLQSLERILESSDLTKLTRKEVRKRLEQELGGSFSSPQWKSKIKHSIEEFVARKQTVAVSQPPTKRRKLNNNAIENGNDNHNNPNHKNTIANKNGQVHNGASHADDNYYDDRRKPRLQSNRRLIEKSDKDNSYFMKLPGDGAKKRCIIHKYRRRLYVGFREYYNRNGEELPSKKGINLTEEQWEFVIKHIDDINAQVKAMRH
eukprot:214735_1